MQDRDSRSEDVLTVDVGPRLFLCIVVALLATILFAVSPRVLRDGDTGWHLATGRYIFENVSVPVTDPFSFSFRGEPWVAHEWLSEVVMFVAYDLGGWSALVAVFALAFGATVVVVTNYCLRWLTPVQAAVMMMIVIQGLFGSMLVRPHLLAWLVLAVWTVAMLDARERDKAPAPAWALLMLVWANMHGSYAFGLFLAAAMGLEALIAAEAQARWNVIRSWGLFGLACLLAALLTPSGVEGLIHPLFISSMEILPLIAEWRPTSFADFSPFGLILYSLLFFALFKPVRVPLVRLLLLIFLLHMALVHVRHHAIFVIVGSLLLARPLGEAWRSGELTPSPGLVQQLWLQWRRYVPALSLAAVAILSVFVFRVVTPMQRPDDIGWPGAALAALPDELREVRVFNEYSFGGALALEGVPVFIDGRADMYGNDFVQDYVDIANEADLEKWQAADSKWNFGWTVLETGRPLALWLDEQDDWEQIYSDSTAVIHVRKPGPPAQNVR